MGHKDPIIGVVGIWHLGSVYAACLANTGFQVLAYDPDPKVVRDLEKGRAPLYEPGLNELLNDGIKKGLLTPTGNPQNLSEADVIYCTFDTPVDENDVADQEFVIEQMRRIFKYIKKNATVVISSQLKVGTTTRLSVEYHESYSENDVVFAYSPENLRLGSAIETFLKADRFVIGVKDSRSRERLSLIYNKIGAPIEWMGVESAEMTKHAINAFLATCVTFANEVAKICEMVGADSNEVERGLKSDLRIGKKAYLRPGPPFSGGTLARDITVLNGLEGHLDTGGGFFETVSKCNQAHRKWCLKKIESLKVKAKNVSILGMAYKSGTDTLRRSESVVLADDLKSRGYAVKVYDPKVQDWPDSLKSTCEIHPELKGATLDVDIIVLTFSCPEFDKLETLIPYGKNRTIHVIDLTSSYEKKFAGLNTVVYHRLGKSLLTSN